MEEDLAKEVAEEILGVDFVARFKKQGFVQVVGRNGHTYTIFAPVNPRDVYDKAPAYARHRGYPPAREGLPEKNWCVFGVDPRYGEPGFLYPRERVFAFRSRLAPVWDELTWIWFALKDDPRPFLVGGCDPLLTCGKFELPAVTRMLKKIGRTLGPADYRSALLESASRKAANS